MKFRVTEINYLEEEKPRGNLLQENKKKYKNTRPPQAAPLRSPPRSLARQQRKSPQSQKVAPVEVGL